MIPEDTETYAQKALFWVGLGALGALIFIFLIIASTIKSYAHDQWADGSSIPDWVKTSCCGPSDAHHLTPDQVHDMGDYYIVDGYDEPIRKYTARGAPNGGILPSQDGDYWIFYSRTPAGWDYSPEGGKSYHGEARESFYCFFVPIAF